MRLIDADALIAEYDRVHIGKPGGAKKLMVDAPTVEERKWIPCSERLPDEKKEVLISAENGLYIAELEIINGREYWSEVMEYRYIENVDAWMPLPEPWEGEGNERA